MKWSLKIVTTLLVLQFAKTLGTEEQPRKLQSRFIRALTAKCAGAIQTTTTTTEANCLPVGSTDSPSPTDNMSSATTATEEETTTSMATEKDGGGSTPCPCSSGDSPTTEGGGVLGGLLGGLLGGRRIHQKENINNGARDSNIHPEHWVHIVDYPRAVQRRAKLVPLYSHPGLYAISLESGPVADLQSPLILKKRSIDKPGFRSRRSLTSSIKTHQRMKRNANVQFGTNVMVPGLATANVGLGLRPGQGSLLGADLGVNANVLGGLAGMNLNANV